jgi:hypothetical protein
MFNKPPRRDYLSVKRYFEQVPPVCNIESYIYCKEDIITLKPGRESAWLDDFVEKIVQKLTCYKRIRVWPLNLSSDSLLTRDGRNYSARESVSHRLDQQKHRDNINSRSFLKKQTQKLQRLSSTPAVAST